METSEERRERSMWDKSGAVTLEELRIFAASCPPMGVCIPKGRVKVPHRTAKTMSHLRLPTRQRTLSHNLLKIDPTSPLSSNTNCVVTNNVRHTSNLGQPELWKPRLGTNMTPQWVQSRSDVNSDMRTMSSNECVCETTPILPPPYTEATLPSCNPFQHEMVTQDVTSQQYYQHLSVIAAMAWSDCNKATLKLKQIYEETAQLSRACKPITYFSKQLPIMQPPEYPSFSTNAFQDVCHHNSAHDGAVTKRLLAYQRCRNTVRTLAQPIGYSNGSFVRPVIQSLTGNGPCGGLPTYQQDPENHYPTFCDPPPANNCNSQYKYIKQKVGEKRKFCEFAQPRSTKLPRLAHPTPSVHYDDTPTSRYFNPSTLQPRQLNSNPPAYERIPPSYDVISDLIEPRRQSTSSNLPVVSRNSLNDVIGGSATFSGVFSLPSVSFSPTQPQISTPFVVR